MRSLGLILVGATATYAQTKPILLADIYENLEKTFPVILLSTREIKKAEFELLAAQGAFDLAIKGAANNNTGYYDSNRLEANIEKPTTLWGTSFFAGYRVSSGDFPDYYGERRTNAAGEIRFGGRIPLWRDRTVDQGRLDLKQSELNKSIAANVLSEQKLGVFRDAAVSYYNWVAAGLRRKIIRDLLNLAETRDDQIKKRVALGDIPAIEQKENERAILARREQLVAAERIVQKSALYLSLYYRTADAEMLNPRSEALPAGFLPEASLPKDMQIADRTHALENRPELRRIQNEIEMEKNALAFHENQRGPQLDLILRGSRDIQNGTNFRRDPWEGDFALVFNIPLQTRKQDGKIGATEEKIRILETKLSYQKDKIGLEISDAIIALENSLQRLEIIRSELAVAENLAKAEKSRFDLGDSTLLIVNLREQTAAEVALRLVGAQADYWSARADYDAIVMRSLSGQKRTGRIGVPENDGKS